MNAGQMRRIMEFEEHLAVGHPVKVYWTENGNVYSGVAVVTSKMRKTINVRLTEDSGDYKAGTMVKSIPCVTCSGWSSRNKVEPVDGYNWGGEWKDRE